jgi:nitrogen regulatory protein PII
MLIFVVEDRIAALVVDAIVDAARTGHESGDGLVWSFSVTNVVHHRTGRNLEEGVEIRA